MGDQVVSLILTALRQGDFRATVHAHMRMNERNVTRHDIQSVGHTCKNWKRQQDGKFKITGFDLDGDEISIVCVLEANVIIITVLGD